MARIIAVGQAAVEGSGDFEPIPAGTKIKVAVYDIEEGVSGPNAKTPGSPQFNWTAKVTEEGKFKGREIRYNYVPLDPNVAHAWNLTQFAKAVGWKMSEKPEGGADIEVPDDLRDVLGTEVVAKISQTPKDDQDRIFNKVDRIFPLPKGGGGGVTEPAKPKWGDL